MYRSNFEAKLCETPENGAEQEGQGFWVPKTTTIPICNSQSSIDDRDEGAGENRNEPSQLSNGPRRQIIDENSRNNMLSEKTRLAHPWLKIRLSYYRRVCNEAGDRYLEADDGSEVWCEEQGDVHLYDVVDRILILMFRDTTRHRYLRCMNNSIGVLHALAFSLYVLFGEVCNVREVRAWERSLLNYVTAFVGNEHADEHSFMPELNNRRRSSSRNVQAASERSVHDTSVVGVGQRHDNGSGGQTSSGTSGRSKAEVTNRANSYFELRRKKREISLSEYTRRLGAAPNRESIATVEGTVNSESDEDSGNVTVRASEVLEAWSEGI